MKAVALTTVDNPYNPFDNFRDWYNYDEDHGYGSCSIVARLAPYSNDFLPSEQIAIIEAAIDRFIEADPIGLYCKVVDTEDVDDSFEELVYDSDDEEDNEMYG